MEGSLDLEQITTVNALRVKVISDFRPGNVHTDATEENGNQREDVICT